MFFHHRLNGRGNVQLVVCTKRSYSCYNLNQHFETIKGGMRKKLFICIRFVLSLLRIEMKQRSSKRLNKQSGCVCLCDTQKDRKCGPLSTSK